MAVQTKDPSPGEPADREEEANQQEREIEGVRENLGQLLKELGRRRDTLLSPRKWLRAHPTTATAVGLTTLAVVAGALLWRARRKPRGPTLGSHFAALTDRWGRALGGPVYIVRMPTGTNGHLLREIATAIASGAAHRLVQRYFAPKSGPPLK